MSGAAAALHRVVRLVHQADGAVTCGPARRTRHAGFHVLDLAGGPYEMAFQHGALLRESIPTGPLPLFQRYLELMLRNSPLGAYAGAVRRALDALVGPRLVRALPPYFRAVVAGLADGAGLREADVLRAYVLPEAVLYAIALHGRLTGAPAAPGCPCTPPMGCSTVVAGRSRARRGQLLLGRNFDFMGVGRWEREATVAFHRPEEGHAYAGVSSAGIFGGGITGMNDAGVTVVVHQHFPRRLDLAGEPVGVVGEEIMREAASVDEAIAVLDRHSPVGSWTYIVADPERAVAYELTPRSRRIVDMQADTLAYANAFVHPDLQEEELGFYPSYQRANHARHARLHALLAAEPAHTEDGVAAILADAHDPQLGRDVALGNTVSTPYTVASVVFRPADRRFWVGQGPAPTSAGPFVGFDLKARGPSGKPRTLEAPVPRESPRLVGLLAYDRGYRAWIERGDLAEARSHVDAALAADPGEALYHNVAGLLALRAGQPEAAERAFRAALARGHLPERQARFRIGLGRALDLGARRTEAREAYTAALAEAPEGDPLARAAARAGLRWRFTARAAREMGVEFFYGDFV